LEEQTKGRCKDDIVTIGGAEINFAIGCAPLGLQVKWISSLGNDEFGAYIQNTVRGLKSVMLADARVLYLTGVFPSIHPANIAADTVGAGDGFNAGAMFGYLRGWPLERTLSFANAAGAMVVSVNGDNEGLPSRTEAEAFLREAEIIER
jgi:sugar/nucleoside kinase (ribokinase family)